MIDVSSSIIFKGSWGSCPNYWRNFIRSLNFEDDASSEFRDVVICKELLKYHAVRVKNDDNTLDISFTVIFETPAHLTWFILRWA